MTIQDMQAIAWENAKKLGWTDKEVPIPEMVVLIHSEATEALEAYRNSEPRSWTDKDGKPQGIGSEFADIMIRLGHYSEALGLNLAYEVKRKLEYNITRPYRHGGKRA